MKKIITLILLLCTFTLLLSSCGSNKIEKPEDTNLEYWLLDKPDIDNWTKVAFETENMYLAKGYKGSTTYENGETSIPECYVAYYVNKYPYTDLGSSKITKIKITDPGVSVWGLNINSTREEIIAVAERLNCKLNTEDENRITFIFEKIWVTVQYGDFIEINAHVPTFMHYLK